MARTKRGWSYPLEAVPAKFRSRRPKDAIRMAATGNTDGGIVAPIGFAAGTIRAAPSS